MVTLTSSYCDCWTDAAEAFSAADTPEQSTTGYCNAENYFGFVRELP